MAFKHLSILERSSKFETAVDLLTRVNEGDDSAVPEIHKFLSNLREREEILAIEHNKAETARDKRKNGGRKNSGLFEVAPRYENGTDFSAEGIVLARKGALRLIWRYGSKFWASQLEPSVYTPGELEVHGENPEQRHRNHRDLTNNHREPGTKDTRLTKALILRYAEQIDAVFGAGTAIQVAELKKTVLVDAA
ncbi:uncharacterized protein NMK_1977 [Novimethylophilus kurashikiensis]|uniref:Uncharacterized protein n=1 Tax=Novimethylophilus kurashikiensis TaxID=1825523 RepID=A0A2R5FA06_9PROT|nr:hypothetical protein [Novimethylophilus kurashikiensis]GBG14378.1 uncharacterized protein NMK_1977 [Novimethylophilus kurashikiensis]